MALLAVVASLLAAEPAAAAPGIPPAVVTALSNPLHRFENATPKCESDAKHCFSLDVHIVSDGGKPVQTPEWFSEHIRGANRLFAVIDVSFQVRSVETIPGKWAEIDTRIERNRLGRDRYTREVIHVFVVERLADVDVEGEQIRGVHWRDGAERSRRWVILSSIASKMVLAHELGHFFGLPHSTYPESIMNKTKRRVPLGDRKFADPEVARMRKKLATMLETGELVPRRKPRKGRKREKPAPE